jgi:hypothetical protein
VSTSWIRRRSDLREGGVTVATRYRRTSPPGKASRNCCAVDAPWDGAVSHVSPAAMFGRYDDEHEEESKCGGRYDE